MRKFLPAVLVLLVGAYFAGRDHWSQDRSGTTTSTDTATAIGVSSTSASQSDAILQRAFENQQSDLQVQGQGVVEKVLRDDNEGSRHQRFLVRLNSGQSLLIAHNIDLAPRVESLRQGDVVAFYGEYEWNNKGGVIHWTHRDPRGRHPAGWLEHDGRRYQ